MAGAGTGYPNWFICPVARRTRTFPEMHYPTGHEAIHRTGKTKPTVANGLGHPRKLWTSHEYVCECGHRGWSSHIDIVRYPVKEEAAT